MRLSKTILFAASCALATAACTRDTSGKLQFDAVKACKAAVLAAPTLDAAKRVALDAGAKPHDVDNAAAVAIDVAAFALVFCNTAT